MNDVINGIVTHNNRRALRQHNFASLSLERQITCIKILTSKKRNTIILFWQHHFTLTCGLMYYTGMNLSLWLWDHGLEWFIEQQSPAGGRRSNRSSI